MRRDAFRPIEAQDPAYWRFRNRIVSIFAILVVGSFGLSVVSATVGILAALWGLSGLTLYVALELYHRTQVEGFLHYRQTQALLSLHGLLTFRQPLPSTRLWAASPDFLVQLVMLMRSLQPSHLVELGSGVSTLIAAYELEHRGAGQITSFDHDALYAERTRQLLQTHALNQWVQIIHAPLRDGWYDTTGMGNLAPIDLLIIDGPPNTTSAQARFPALPALFEHLRPGALILVDDYARADEYAMVQRWLEGFDVELIEEIPNEKGAAILRKK